VALLFGPDFFLQLPEAQQLLVVSRFNELLSSCFLNCALCSEDPVNLLDLLIDLVQFLPPSLVPPVTGLVKHLGLYSLNVKQLKK
jgi:hypothetical protein